jgi:hypothetical protein
MKPLKQHKGFLILAAVGLMGLLIAIGAQGGAGKGGAGRALDATDARDGAAEVMGQIDSALGRNDTASEAGRPQTQPELRVPPAGAAPPAPSAKNGEASSTVSDRRIVQTSTIRLQVKEVGGGFEEVTRIATSSGGFLASSSFSHQGEQQIASATIRVPATRYQEVLAELRRLGARVDSEASNASDVTEEYSDHSARLRNLEATETQLLSFLAQARNVGEVLQVQDRLNTTRNEIERVKGRINLLDKLTDLATITVHLRPVVAGSTTPDGGGLGAAVRAAWEDSLEFLEGVAATVITAVVFLWWLPFVAVPVYFAWQRFGRRATPRAATPAES